jgi:predicted nuclease of predicted toxin-antitoxin system
VPGLLFDENLSEAVVDAISNLFPGSVHVRSLGLGGAPDVQVWETAKQLGVFLLTRDYDFQAMSVMHGHPPKVIHLDAFNPTNSEVIAVLRGHAADIDRFAADEDGSFLTLRIRRPAAAPHG